MTTSMARSAAMVMVPSALKGTMTEREAARPPWKLMVAAPTVLVPVVPVGPMRK
jgi:hypothetical protein